MRSLRPKIIILKNWNLIPSIRMFKLKFNHPKMLALLLLMGAAGLFISTPGLCGRTVAEEIISLDLVEQPLGEVLDDITAATGYRFIFDESWENFLISASIKNEPLHKGLKRILGKLNNAIIYSSDRTIKIIIFDEANASANRHNALSDRTSDTQALQQPYALPVGSLPASPRATRRLLDVEDDNRLSEESDTAVPEPDEASPEEEKSSGDETRESTPEAGGEDGSQQTEDTPDAREDESQQTEDTSDGDDQSPDESTIEN